MLILHFATPTCLIVLLFWENRPNVTRISSKGIKYEFWQILDLEIIADRILLV